MAKRFADGREWALAYKEFRQRFFNAFGEGGRWREEEWGKMDLNVGARSCAWRRYKVQGKSAVTVTANAAVGQRQKKRKKRGTNDSLHRFYSSKEEVKEVVCSAFREVGILRQLWLVKSWRQAQLREVRNRGVAHPRGTGGWERQEMDRGVESGGSSIR